MEKGGNNTFERLCTDEVSKKQAGKKTQELKALAALAKALSSIQHLHGSSQLYVTAVPGDLIPCSHLHGHFMHMEYTHTHTHANKTPIHVK